MLIVMNPKATAQQVDEVVKFIEHKGFQTHISRGDVHTVIGAVGDKTIDMRDVEIMDGVDNIIKISTSYKLASRTFKPDDTVVDVKGVKFGGGYCGMIAGPCTIESYEQMDETAKVLAQTGVRVLRGGAFKPRTSPYSFQGLGEEGLKIIREVADKYNMVVASEVMEISQIDLFVKYADILQVGARNMQNFNLLRELSYVKKPIILKRGLSSTIDEWLMSAEYLLSDGNGDVILCERGIRTFERATRNTLDISAIPVVQKLSHLPIIVDPSHGTGLRDKVLPMSRAAAAAGADGIMVEVHHSPSNALCDGPQSLYPQDYDKLFNDIKVMLPLVGKQIN
ncbi:MAG: 3-deoxy-7-phosphoheptulonate synthase [Candidatus Gastranaerophilales bacterium]|nr:3-deoxy-7-phosphoheptulonate synthase [Candidatus Gastranaerophilales bacterium]